MILIIEYFCLDDQATCQDNHPIPILPKSPDRKIVKIRTPKLLFIRKQAIIDKIITH